MASAAQFHNKMLIGQNPRRAFRLSGTLCAVRHFVWEDSLMLAIFVGWSGMRFLFVLRADADFF
jgi:hypothetical protein